MRHSKDDSISVPSLAACNDRLLYHTHIYTESLLLIIVFTRSRYFYKLYHSSPCLSDNENDNSRRVRNTSEISLFLLSSSPSSSSSSSFFAQNQLSRCNFIFSIFFDDVVGSYIIGKKKNWP